MFVRRILQNSLLQRAGSASLAVEESFVVSSTSSQRLISSTTNALDDGDVVMSAFKKQQANYTELMKGLSKVDVPLEGDAAAIKGYASEVEKLKKKIGMPDYDAIVKAEMTYAMSVAGNDVKKFVQSVLGELDVSKTAYEGIGQDVMDAIAEAEKASGKSLDASNEKGWTTLSSKITAIEKKYGLQDSAKVKEEAVLEMYTRHIQSIKDTVEGELAKVKDAEGIQVGKVDLKGLKPQVA